MVFIPFFSEISPPFCEEGLTDGVEGIRDVELFSAGESAAGAVVGEAAYHFEHGAKRAVLLKRNHVSQADRKFVNQHE